jgi:hypothetical protein
MVKPMRLDEAEATRAGRKPSMVERYHRPCQATRRATPVFLKICKSFRVYPSLM